MAQLAREAAANPAFRDRARSLASNISLDHWVRLHFRYVNKPFQIIQTPLRSVDEIEAFGVFEGYCADVATLYAGLLLARGERPELVAIQAVGSQTGFTHVYTQNAGVIYDPTVAVGTVYRFTDRMTLKV